MLSYAVLLQPMKEEPPSSAKCRDKFLVQSTIITPERETTSLSDIWGLVEKEDKNGIHEQKIRCAFLPSTTPAVPEEGEYAMNSSVTNGGDDVSDILGSPTGTISLSHRLTNASAFLPPFPYSAFVHLNLSIDDDDRNSLRYAECLHRIVPRLPMTMDLFPPPLRVRMDLIQLQLHRMLQQTPTVPLRKRQGMQPWQQEEQLQPDLVQHM